MQPFRLERSARIDRESPIEFQFDGKRLAGYAGDTLASALLANGVRVVGRSFKYHRPRGVVGSGAEEPNALVQLGRGATTVPNLRATQVELVQGMEASSVRGWPSLGLDLGAVNGWFSSMLSAGFYYKTFMWPRAFWHRYESIIRSAAGLGKAPPVPDPDYYEHRNAFCDVLVVGAGPAGLMAALAAGRAGARVMLVDEQNEPGGTLLRTETPIDGKAPDQWLAETLEALDSLPEVQVLTRSTAFGYFDHNFVAVGQRLSDHLPYENGPALRERLWRIRARQVVLAQGAFERPLVFSNNDRPGVMLASAVSTYVKRYAVAPGRRMLLFTNNDSGYQAALDFHASGLSVEAIVDSRLSGAGDLGEAARHAGIPIQRGCAVIDVSGRKAVRGATVMKLTPDGHHLTGSPTSVSCDLIAMSGGWSPAIHLHSQAGGRTQWNAENGCIIPAESSQANISAGSGNGTFSLEACLHEGRQAGNRAARQCGFEVSGVSTPAVAPKEVNATQALWEVPALQGRDRCPKQFVDYQNDTSAADIHLAVREGYRNVEHVKRYTALGFGTDQGKLGNINGMAILADALKLPIEDVGTTTFRPAYTPITFGTCAGLDVGPLYEPVRKTAIHAWHENAGSPFEVVGQWLRPWYFPKAGEDLHAAVNRECLAVRSGVGMLDASTLGKIDVQGPDATTFLEYIYTHDIAKLKPGRCAYGIMLGEDGMVKDDGVMARLGEQHYYLTTTTGGAAHVLAWLEQWLQTEWPELEVYLTSLTDHFSTIAVAGPDSRKVLQAMDSDMDFSADAFPFMSVQSGTLAGMAAQVFRISFSGELAFEVNISSNDALAMWELLMEAGATFDITPYGTETMHVLRAEKGFVIVGQDTDGSVTPVDLGMNWMLSKHKDYLGKRSLARSDTTKANRKQWVGLLSKDNQTVLPEGAQLVEDPAVPKPVPMIGHVTSSYYSAHLKHPIALALIERGRSRHGEQVTAVSLDGTVTPVEIVSPVFYDPKGERQRV